VSVNTGGLKNGTYHGVVSVTASGLPSGTPDVTAVAPITLQIGPGPAIFDGGIVPVFSFLPVIQPGSWFSIYGANLAGATAVWNGDFPTSLGRVTVTVNGKPAYLWYVSPGQINLQAPDDTTRGTVTVTVTNANGTASSSVGLSDSSPSLSLFDATYVAG